MAEERKAPRGYTADNFTPEIFKKNYVPPTVPNPSQSTGQGAENNYVPTTGSSEPVSPPPMPKKK